MAVPKRIQNKQNGKEMRKWGEIKALKEQTEHENNGVLSYHENLQNS